ncbi:NAD-dependent epimerase/dehydratase family protein [Brevundimonas sp. NPDC058933]|uniref:NAD-dependent epimerase/dehydratase family protein n=1 Tax=Brevundimonas sp. NPDC058933 TaxID=3346673 RepID=UPI003BEEF667
MAPLQGKRIFITGGAGFIGSRLTRALANAGASVVIFDNLLEQVHGPQPQLDLAGVLIKGDVRDAAALSTAVQQARPDIVYHLAAETGTGQSADEPSRYAAVNVVGCANLIEALKALETPPQRVVLAATRAVYGEGAYVDAEGRTAAPEPRSVESMANGVFDLFDDQNRPLTPAPTHESLPPRPGSVYGSTKLMQEYLLQQTPAPWDVVILRLQNVYGPGQSLRNPYTGVLSIFCQQAMAGRTLDIYEDGEIYRDFIFVDDVVAAFVAAALRLDAGGALFNVGSGEASSILAAADMILEDLGLKSQGRRISGAYRAGDIRYAVADVAKARDGLGWSAQVPFRDGVRQLVKWAQTDQSIAPTGAES